MAYSISRVKADDVDQLVRKVEYPAQQENPLTRLMFPRPREQMEQREGEIQWTIDGLLEAVYRGDETLYKACGVDGSPVGLIGWTTSVGVPSEEVNGVDHGGNGPTGMSGVGHGMSVESRSSWCPSSLDVVSWLDVSRQPREERRRILRGCQGKGVCRRST